MPIQLLPDALINQIKAGEVVERPAAVVKELVENALDAGASRIKVELEDGGLAAIIVRDDGQGIAVEELPLALARHATSKIASLDELEQVASLGFRGEALASILAVSRLTLTSRIASAAHGWRLMGEGGLGSALPVPAAHPQGSTVEVRDLFYSTPARRKFVKSPATEARHTETALRRLALARPEAALQLSHNGRLLFAAEPAFDEASRKARLRAICGAEFLANAVERQAEAGGLRLAGYIALPSFSRPQADLQFLSVNGRAVRDRLLGAAIRRAYADALHSSRHPAYALSLSLDWSAVDVNVHPQKTEVRFRDSAKVHDFLFSHLHRWLREVRPEPEQHHGVSFAAAPDQAQRLYSLPLSTGYSAQERPSPAWPASSATWLDLARTAAPATTSPGARVDEPEAAVEHPLGYALAQLHGLFILAQNARGLVVVDMHAAHERMLYERYKRELSAGGVPAQQLLSPLNIQVGEDEADTALARADELARAGLVIERSGPASLFLRALPALLAQDAAAELLREVLGKIGDSGAHAHLGEVLDAQHRVLAEMACKAAIKANRVMTVPEMNALLREMEQTDLAGQCNHGRPTWVQIGVGEFDRLFLRGR